jgi:hypothetical protein
MTHRYSQSPWQPKRTAKAQLAFPNNYVIPLWTYAHEPNPWIDRVRIRNRSREERYRLGQDIGWVTIGTSSGR